MTDVKTKDYYTGINLKDRVNCYICETCKHITKTKDIDAGVTPMFHSCENCGERATSSGYNDIAPELKPTQEWYRPDLQEILKLNTKIPVLDHVFNGGLLNRKIKL